MRLDGDVAARSASESTLPVLIVQRIPISFCPATERQFYDAISPRYIRIDEHRSGNWMVTPSSIRARASVPGIPGRLQQDPRAYCNPALRVNRRTALNVSPLAFSRNGVGQIQFAMLVVWLSCDKAGQSFSSVKQ